MEDKELRINIIISAIKKGFHTFDEISQNAKGIYPSELKEILSDLVGENRVLKNNGYYVLKENKGTTILPLPHPHDYDWRFSKQSCIDLSKHILQHTHKYDVILLFGAPSLFVTLFEYIENREVVLIDWNNELINVLKSEPLPNNFFVYQFDLFDNTKKLHELLYKELEIKNAEYIFFDPPWYTNHYHVFIKQSSNLSKVGTLINMSMFPINTRPCSYSDRWKIIQIAENYGFHLTNLSECAITYSSPPFEISSLKHDNLEVSLNWRKSDLFTFVKVHNETNYEEKNFSINFDDDVKWGSFLIENRKIKLKYDFEIDLEEPKMISIEKGDILKTVSRRYDNRKMIDIWFWDNKVFALTGKTYFFIALSELSNIHYELATSKYNREYINKAKELITELLKSN